MFQKTFHISRWEVKQVLFPLVGACMFYHSGLNENILEKSKNIEKNILENIPDNSLKMVSDVGALSMGGACMFIILASMKIFQKNLRTLKRIFQKIFQTIVSRWEVKWVLCPPLGACRRAFIPPTHRSHNAPISIMQHILHWKILHTCCNAPQMQR